MAFSVAEAAACQKLIDLALAEELDLAGDVTSLAVIPADCRGQGAIVARAAGVVAGLPAAVLVCKTVAANLRWEPRRQDGDRVEPGDILAEVAGPMRSLLIAERTALNFLQHLSGIATLTRRFVDAVAGLACQILDTRKTLPGWRLLEKYAIRCGGGQNHRLGLYDGILIKDNHLASLKPLPLSEVVADACRFEGGRFPVEVEVDSLDLFDQALTSDAELILLDNMSPDDLREAVARRNQTCDPENWILLEASGGVNLHNVRAVAQTGVDRISIGALTHSAAALDLALDFKPWMNAEQR